jgi:anti-sigma factor RsiW
MKEHLIVRELLTLEAAEILDPSEERQVQQHMLQCDECRAEHDEWAGIAGALKALPIPQASQRLVVQTQRLLFSAAAARKRQASKIGMALLVIFSWMVAFMTLGFVRMLGVPLTRWLDVSSTTLWITYIGISWFATALAAGILGKRYQQESRTV